MRKKYFIFVLNNDGYIEPIIWFETLKEAKNWKKKYLENKPIYIGKFS